LNLAVSQISACLESQPVSKSNLLDGPFAGHHAKRRNFIYGERIPFSDRRSTRFRYGFLLWDLPTQTASPLDEEPISRPLFRHRRGGAPIEIM
jgi:hypothetical protein